MENISIEDVKVLFPKAYKFLVDGLKYDKDGIKVTDFEFAVSERGRLCCRLPVDGSTGVWTTWYSSRRCFE
jgi:hypothetical protein